MKITKTGGFYRYDKSPVWFIHRDYFLNTGIAAWTKGDVPYTGISNYYEAYKKALLFIENLEYQDEIPTKLRILEIGAGFGEFAFNFLKCCSDICKNKELDFFGRITYVLSDFSRTTLEELESSERFKNFEHKDQIELLALDVLSRASFVELENSFDLVMGNYLLDQLPARVFYRRYNQLEDNFQYYEKYTALEDKSSWQNRIRSPKKLIKKIQKQHEFREIDLADSIPFLEFEALDSCFKQHKSSTTIYSYSALTAVENFRTALKDTGIILCSDFNASTRPYRDNYEPCYYGNSLALAVNFEFIYKYFQHSQKVLLFEDPIKPLHTLVLTRDSFPYSLQLGEAYNKVFKQNWFLRAFYRYMVELKYSFYLLLLGILAFIGWYLIF